MEMGKRETRKATIQVQSGRANELTMRRERALKSAARWLQRRGRSRSHRETKSAYNEAASLITKLAKKH